jgi:cytochrome P450
MFHRKFDETLPYLASGIMPWLFAPKGNRARIRVQTALAEYYRQHKTEKDFPEATADITLLRHRVFRGLGFNDSEIGRMELTMVFAGTNNSVPLLFWIIVNVFARPGVVERLREEVKGAVDLVPIEEAQEADGEPAPRRRKANVRASLLTDEARFPYLAAIQREVLRLCNTTTGFRHAMQDTTLPDGTFLRAGSTVHIPTSISHRLPEVWGPSDPSEFEPTRWLKTSGTPGLIKAPAAYFPFGGGKHLCPGRGFAYAENAGFLVTLALGFTITGLTPETQPLCPIANLMGEGVPKPRQRAAVHITRRQGWEDVHWNLTW